MIDLIKIDSSKSILPEQAACRGVAGAINFMLITAASTIIRRKSISLPEGDEPNHIDNYNENIAAQEEAEENLRVREEQGFSPPVDIVEQAAVLKILLSHLSDNMEDHARKVEAATRPGYMLPEPFDMPESIARTLDRQMKSRPPISEARKKQEAELLGVSEEDVEAAHERRGAQQISFLKVNAKEIQEIIRNVHWTGEPLDEYQAFEWLEPIVQLRLLAGADSGLWFARQQQIERFRNNAEEAAGNIRLFDDLRLKVHNERDRLMRIESFKRKVDDAILRGATLPRFNVRPLEPKKAKVA